MPNSTIPLTPFPLPDWYLESKGQIDVEKQALTAKEGFSFGCDPEVFIRDANDRLVSAAGLIPGTKTEPHKVEGGAIQVDGMAAEINTDPAKTFDDFHRNINSVMGQLEAMLPKGYKIDISPSVIFPQDVLDAASEEAKELGCCPDFNAWTGAVNMPPDVSVNPGLRTAAGHLHIGWLSEGGEPFSLDDKQHIMNCRDLVKQLDWYLGAWSLSLDPDPIRRSLYGKSGACRFKPYGVEYRVLSNFWLTSKDRRLAVWNRMQKAIADMNRKYMPDQLPVEYSNHLRMSIDTSVLSPLLQADCSYPIRSITARY